MRELVIKACLIGSGIIVLLSTHILSSLFLFVLAGIVPGSTTLVAPQFMLVIFSVLAFAIIAWIVIGSIVHHVSIDRLARQYMTKKKRTRKTPYAAA
jgi:predicted membrane protein